MKLLQFLVVFSIPFVLARPLSGGGILTSDQDASGYNVFACELYEQLSDRSGNVVLSPFSIYLALSMAQMGSGSETARQIARVLHLPTTTTNGNIQELSGLLGKIDVDNASHREVRCVSDLWAQAGYPFEIPFQTSLQQSFHTTLHQIDLTGWPGEFDPVKAARARALINASVANETSNKILELIPVKIPTPSTRLMLVNAMYFKYPWAIQFDTKSTQNRRFNINLAESVLVPSMYLKGRLGYAKDEDFQILELSFKSHTFSMLICLPREDKSVAGSEATVTVKHFMQLQRQVTVQDITVILPKFKIQCQMDLVAQLESMGMRDAFLEGSADFSGITKVKPFFVEDVIQSACLDVTEEGAEASAATAIALGDSRDESPVFNVNHPFLFVIRHNATGAVLLIGRVMNPLL